MLNDKKHYAQPEFWVFQLLSNSIYNYKRHRILTTNKKISLSAQFVRKIYLKFYSPAQVIKKTIMKKIYFNLTLKRHT